MKTITVKMPDDLAVRLEKRAKRLGLSKSTLIREFVKRDLDEGAAVEEEPSAYDLMKSGFGSVKSGVGDLSTNPKRMKGFGH